MRTTSQIVVCWGLVVACVVSPAPAQPGCETDRQQITAQRGIIFEEASVSPGQWYWKLVDVEWCDYDHSGGKINIFYHVKDADGNFITNQECFAGWPFSSYPSPPPNQVPIDTKAYPEWGDFPMTGGSWCPAWPEGGNGPYSAWVGDNCPANGSYCPSQASYPSDTVWGMGLPCNYHECYYLTWQFSQASGPSGPEIARSPASFTRSVTQGQNLSSDTFEVWNSGGETLNYSITDDAGWLSVNPASGSSTGEHDTITIDYTTAGLGVGSYNATITITGNATNSPQTLAVAVTVTSGGGEPRWHLAYWRRVGDNVNHGNHSIYIWTFDRLGQPVGNQPILDANNNQRTITAPDGDPKVGYSEWPIYPSDGTVQLKVGGDVPSDLSPPMDPTLPEYGHNSWEVGFMLVEDDTDFSFDQTVVGDPSNGAHAPHTASFAYYDTDPYDYASDSRALAGSASTQGQTFVASANRVVCAKVQATVGGGVHLRWRGRIREGGPGGQQLGATITTREIVSDDFWDVMLIWPLEGNDAVTVTPGNTYYFEVERADTPGDINVWRVGDNYSDGQLYIGGSPQPNNDIQGWVVCGMLGEAPPPEPEISRSPTSFSRTVTVGQNLSSDTFEVWNSGGETLNYSITDNVGWLSVNPAAGSSTGEHDTITINYATAGLGVGSYNATITITGNAANSPQTIAVAVEVEPISYMGDCDEDQDVDQEDFGTFQICLSGPGVEQNDPDCVCAKLDVDVDVDQDDFSLFEQCMSGPDLTPPANCQN